MGCDNWKKEEKDWTKKEHTDTNVNTNTATDTNTEIQERVIRSAVLRRGLKCIHECLCTLVYLWWV